MAEKPANKDHGQSLGVVARDSMCEHFELMVEAFRLDWLEADEQEVGGAAMAIPVGWQRTFEALERAHRLGSPGEPSDRLMALPEDQGKGVVVGG